MSLTFTTNTRGKPLIIAGVTKERSIAIGPCYVKE